MYWLFDWLSGNNVQDQEDVTRLVSRKPDFQRLRNLAEDFWSRNCSDKIVGVNLVAGSGSNMSGLTSCWHTECRRKQIDTLFRHTWHYFDKIILPDEVGAMLLGKTKPGERFSDYRGKLISDILTAKHIQDIGAAPLVHYYPRHYVDKSTVEKTFKNMEARGFVEHIKKAMMINNRFAVEQKENGKYEISYYGEDTTTLCAGLDEKEFQAIGENKAKENYLTMKIKDELGYFLDDLRNTKLHGGAIGSSLETHQHFLSVGDYAKEGVIALHIDIPSLENIPVHMLIQLRQDENDAFERFRCALKAALKTLAKEQPGVHHKDLAKKIASDIVEPEIANIRNKLNAAQRALFRKSATTMYLGALGTTCGILLGVPEAMALIGGIGTLLTGTGTAAYKYLDQVSELEMSDMYFLWKAVGHAR